MNGNIMQPYIKAKFEWKTCGIVIYIKYGKVGFHLRAWSGYRDNKLTINHNGIIDIEWVQIIVLALYIDIQ